MLTAQRYCACHDNLATDQRLNFGLNQIGEAAGNDRFDADRFAGFSGTGDFNASHRGELQSRQWSKAGIALRHDSGQLSSGLDQQDAREKRLTRKVPAQKMFVTFHRILGNGTFPGLKAY